MFIDVLDLEWSCTSSTLLLLPLPVTSLLFLSLYTSLIFPIASLFFFLFLLLNFLFPFPPFQSLNFFFSYFPPSSSFLLFVSQSFPCSLSCYCVSHLTPFPCSSSSLFLSVLPSTNNCFPNHFFFL